MASVLSLSRSEYTVVWLPAEPSVDTTMPAADGLKDDPVPSNDALPRRDPLVRSRFLMAFCIGVIATLAWQSCSDAARQLAGTSSLRFSGGVVSVAQTSSDVIAPASFAAPVLEEQPLAALEQNVDQLDAKQGQINPRVVPLASAQEQITRDFASLQQKERHAISNISVPLPRPAPAETRRRASRPATALASAGPNAHLPASLTTVWPSSASPVLSTRLYTGHKRIRSSAATLRSSPPEPFSQGLISVSQSLMLALARITGMQL